MSSNVEESKGHYEGTMLIGSVCKVFNIRRDILMEGSALGNGHVNWSKVKQGDAMDWGID